MVISSCEYSGVSDIKCHSCKKNIRWDDLHWFGFNEWYYYQKHWCGNCFKKTQAWIKKQDRLKVEREKERGKLTRLIRKIESKKEGISKLKRENKSILNYL